MPGVADNPIISWEGRGSVRASHPDGVLPLQEVEFALGPFGVTPQRDEVVDFSEPVYRWVRAGKNSKPF